MPPAQLALPLKLSAYARFATFEIGANRAALAHLEAQAIAAAGSVWLWGGVGLGKTHLLQAVCAAAHERSRRAMYLSLGDSDAEPGWLEGLDGLDVLALDDIDCVAGRADWDRALFRLLDLVAAAAGDLVIAALVPPQALPFTLPDLASRAAAAAVYRLQPLDDASRIAAVEAHARARGLDMDARALRYLVDRTDRDMAVLCRWLDVLDTRSLVTQRRVTLPFVRQILGEAPDARAPG